MILMVMDLNVGLKGKSHDNVHVNAHNIYEEHMFGEMVFSGNENL